MPDFTFKDNSGQVLNALKAQMDTAMETIGLVAEGYAKAECPVDTGRLRNSISHSTNEDTAYIGTNVEYAPYQEFGVPSHNIKAHHYLKKAVQNHTSEYKKMVESALKG